MFGPVGLRVHSVVALTISAISRRRRSHAAQAMSVSLGMDDKAIDRADSGRVRDAHENPAHISRVVKIVIRRIDFAVWHDDLGVLVKGRALRAIRIYDRRAVRQPDRPRVIGVAPDTRDRISISLSA